MITRGPEERTIQYLITEPGVSMLTELDAQLRKDGVPGFAKMHVSSNGDSVTVLMSWSIPVPPEDDF